MILPVQLSFPFEVVCPTIGWVSAFTECEHCKGRVNRVYPEGLLSLRCPYCLRDTKPNPVECIYRFQAPPKKV